MTRLPQITGKGLAKLIESLGFVHQHTVGSHMIFRHPDGRKTVVPVHGSEPIGPGLLNKIIKKDLGISREEFLSLTK